MKYNFRGPYPTMANWLIVKKREDGMYSVRNALTEEVYCMDSDTYHFLRNLNGRRDPLIVAQRFNVDAEALMEYFAANALIRKGRSIEKKLGSFMYTLYIPKHRKPRSILPKLYGLILYLSWLPILIYGIYRAFYTTYDLAFDGVIFGCLAGIVIGAVLHEVSHAMLSLATEEAYFLEAGVFLEKFMPGAYVLIDRSEIKSKAKRILIFAAGVVSNLFLTGLFLVLCTMQESISGFCFGSALVNVALVGLNLTMLQGLDGCMVVDEILGMPQGKDGVKNLFWGCIKASDSAPLSCNQKMVIITCLIMAVYQILQPLLLINGILIILGN